MNAFGDEFIIRPGKSNISDNRGVLGVKEWPLDKADATHIVDELIDIVPFSLVGDGNGKHRAIRIRVHVVRPVANGKRMDQRRFDYLQNHGAF